METRGIVRRSGSPGLPRLDSMTYLTSTCAASAAVHQPYAEAHPGLFSSEPFSIQLRDRQRNPDTLLHTHPNSADTNHVFQEKHGRNQQ